MTDLNTILNADWDTNIIAKPTFLTYTQGNMQAYVRCVATLEITFSEEIIGIGENRVHFSPDSYRAYDCYIRADSKANGKLIVKAIRKVLAQLTPTTEENIGEYDGPELTEDFNDVMVEYHMTIYLRKAGKLAY